MATLIKNVHVIDPRTGFDAVDDVVISPEEIRISPQNVVAHEVMDGTGKILAPGLIDLHVHFREPGFTHKETIASGIRAALAGGVTSALVMPNTNPTIDAPKHVAFQLERARRFDFDLMVSAAASVGLKGEVMTDVQSLKAASIKALTDDGRPILDNELMEKVLRRCRMHKLICMQHAEDTRLSQMASINCGRTSARLGIPGQESAAEYNLVARDIALAERIGARYHVLHLSCKESLRLVADAKTRGAPVSCEVAPHHLLLCDDDVIDRDTFKKMNPPLRAREDARALVNALATNTIDAVASDHAPHSQKEKRAPLTCAPFGVVGLESSILILLTLVKKQKLSLRRAIELMTAGPARVLGEEQRIGSLFGAAKNAVLLDPNCARIFSRRDLVGTSFNSPYFGMEIFGRVNATFLNGAIKYRSNV